MGRHMGNGEMLPDGLVGTLKDSSALFGQPGALSKRLKEDGYLFLRGVLPKTEVLAARAEVLHRLAGVGEVAEPESASRWSGTSRRGEIAGDLGAFWKSVSTGPGLRAVSHGRGIHGLVAEVLGTEAIGQDFLYLRAGVPGTGTDLHYDYPFFARRSDSVVTCWVPLGRVPVEQGPLVLVEGSNRFSDLIDDIRSLDVVANPGKRAAFETKLRPFAESRHTRLLTADFEPGDIVIMSMFIAHASLDNHTTDKSIRLSFDLRYQPKSEPIDDRFFGPDPIGITGKGYAELNGAKPLGQSWHQR